MELTWALLRLLESVQLVTLSTLRFPVGTLTVAPPSSLQNSGICALTY